MLGTCLAFVGITLLVNGIVGINGWHKKNLVLLNLLTGGLIVIFNVYLLITNTIPQDNIRYFGALLFGFTNILIAINCAYILNEKVMGWFCLFCAICAGVLGVYFIIQGFVLAGIMWLVWLLIWFFAFIGFALNEKFLPATNIMFIVQGATSTLGLGLLILLDLVKLY